MKIIKIKDCDGIVYHLNAKYISGWFYSKGQTGITTNHGWNYSVQGNIVDKLDRALLNTNGHMFDLTGGERNVRSGETVL